MGIDTQRWQERIQSDFGAVDETLEALNAAIASADMNQIAVAARDIGEAFERVKNTVTIRVATNGIERHNSPKFAWPTDHKVITQTFGANPAWYQPQFPGHEGLDLRAPTGSNVYAIADAKVVQIGHPPNAAYGYHIRIEFEWQGGVYQAIYAHLLDGSAFVKVGERVEASQRIALADSSGNCKASAAHLHLTLKDVSQLGNSYGGCVDPAQYFDLTGVTIL